MSLYDVLLLERETKSIGVLSFPLHRPTSEIPSRLIFHFWHSIGDGGVRGPAKQRRRWWPVVVIGKGRRERKGGPQREREREVCSEREGLIRYMRVVGKFDGLSHFNDVTSSYWLAVNMMFVYTNSVNKFILRNRSGRVFIF